MDERTGVLLPEVLMEYIQPGRIKAGRRVEAMEPHIRVRTPIWDHPVVTRSRAAI